MNKPTPSTDIATQSAASADINCDWDPNSITADQAKAHILSLVKPIRQIESIALRQTLGRVIAKDVKSRVQVPNHTNSAMDGYALRGEELPADGTRQFNVIGISFAGKPYVGDVSMGQCVRIMTGAVIPKNCNTVVAQERVSRADDVVTVNTGEKTGNNMRYAGEDLQIGDIAIAAGTRIGPAHIGLAASLGFSELPVFRKPRVAFFSNGDELRSVGEPLEIGELYDSNRYTLFAMLEEAGAEVIDLGIVRDQQDAIRQAFIDAAECADMIITSAGASVGDADYVQETLEELGEVGFWKVAIKPGRPLAFGKVDNSLFFGLPGNPVSVIVTFQIFVRIALKRLAGEKQAATITMRVPLTSKLRKRPGRAEFQRGILSVNAEGETEVSSTGEQGSGILHSMSAANCYIILPTDSEGAEPGELVEVQPFAQLF